MKLIKDLGTRLINGKWIRFGIFLCPIDTKEVEKIFHNGLKAKSCGCNWHNFTEEHNQNIAKSLKGKKKSEKHKQELSKVRIEKGLAKGQNNPMYGKNHTEKARHLISEKNKNNSYRKGKKHTEESRQKMREAKLGKYDGENNPMYDVHLFGELNSQWQGGKSFEPYSPEFNDILKDYIKNRDNYTCQCPDCIHLSDILCIHHIDYNKQNNSLDNLITLCRKCHLKTNGKNNRLFWTEFYQSIIINRIVECLL